MSENTPITATEYDREFELTENIDSEEYRAEGPDSTPIETDPVDHAEQREEIEFDEESRD